MTNTMKDKVADAGHAVADAAKTAGHKIAECTEKAVDFVKEKTGIGGPAEGTDAGIAGIKEHMDVIASCGKKVGVVDNVGGGAIKLTKKDSSDGQHHFLPVGDESGVLQHLEVERQPRLRRADRVLQVADTPLAPAQHLEHRETGLVGERVEQAGSGCPVRDARA